MESTNCENRICALVSFNFISIGKLGRTVEFLLDEYCSSLKKTVQLMQFFTWILLSGSIFLKCFHGNFYITQNLVEI